MKKTKSEIYIKIKYTLTADMEEKIKSKNIENKKTNINTSNWIINVYKTYQLKN